MALDLSKIAKQKKIKYFLISYVDFFGVLRSKLVPTQSIKEMQKEGAGFAGFSTYLDMSPADADMVSIPDPSSLIQLPWQTDVGWLAGDLWLDGRPVEASPRVMLRNQIAKLAKKNMYLKSGVECEYFLITPEGDSIADKNDIADKPCYDQSALMRQYDLIKAICDSMIFLGWGPYQNDHEDANGQFEMNWDFSDCLRTADRHVFFKFMVRTLAEKKGLRATFMPKPFLNKTGNGCHAHLSIWNKKGKKITVEVDNLNQLKKIIGLKFDRILFDNMSLKNLRKGIKLSNKLYETEASGGITLKNVKKTASTGVKRISVGQITHSAPAVDFKLDLY